MKQSISTNSKGQVWSLDLVIAGVIVTIGIIILYVYAINYTNQSQKNLENLFYEGNLAAELTLSEDSFGILTDQRVNQTKLDEFYNNYDSKRAEMRITKNFYFTMENLTANVVSVDYVGNKSATTDSSVKITRITVYKNKPTKFELFIWE